MIGQVLPHDGRCHFGVFQPTNRLDIHLRKALRNKQTALVGQALCNGLRRTYHTVPVSRAEKLHCRRSFSSAGPQWPFFDGSGKRHFLPFPTGAPRLCGKCTLYNMYHPASAVKRGDLCHVKTGGFIALAGLLEIIFCGTDEFALLG